MKKISVGLVDDHVLLRKGLASLVNSFDGYEVIFEADNGRALIEKLSMGLALDLLLLDINMPDIDGFTTAQWLSNNLPELKFIALSMYDAEANIIRMLKAGARGYILKDTDPGEFKRALDNVITKGYFFSDLVSSKLVHNLKASGESSHPADLSINLTQKELLFIKLACTELTYKEISEKMMLSVRTIDGYRDAIFDKLRIKSRVGLVMYAIKNNITFR